MITRKLLEFYLNTTLGNPKFTHQGLSYDCPKCDFNGHKKNLEINLERGVYNCWSCRYSGIIKMLMEDYANNPNFKNLPEFKNKEQDNKEIHVKELNYPKETIPYYLNLNTSKYLVEERKISKKELIKRKISFVYSKEEMYYNHICFPFYENGSLVGACIQNFNNKKYRNLGFLNFVPYKEFINTLYPITITEGCYDALSGINAIPILRTEINKETLEFLNDKDVILALDNTVDLKLYTKQMTLLEKAQVKSLTLFNMGEFKDLNEYSIKDNKNFLNEYKNCFDKIFNS